MDDTTVIISVILAVSAIVGTCGLVVASVWKLSGLISGLSARMEGLEKRMDDLAAEVRGINEHLRHRST